MRGLLRLALVPLAAAVMAGCTIEETPESESSLKVAHASGETRVPALADRVVALTSGALDTALALGLKPVGASTRADGRFPTYLGGRTRGIEATGPYARPFFNAVEFVGPDLILGAKNLQGRYYERLQAVASTVMSEDSGHSWEVNTRLYGEAMARTDLAERVLRRYDARSERARRSLDRFGELEVSVARVLEGRVVALGSRSFAGTVLGDAGLGRPRAQRAERREIDASGARLRRLEGDVLLITVPPGAGRFWRELRNSAAWLRLGPVRSGRVLRVADDVWGAGSGVLAAQAALASLERLPR